MREGLNGPRSETDPPLRLVAATDVRLDDLQELTHGLRADLLERGEFLPSSWVEEAAGQLKSGELQGWVLPGPPLGGLAFVSPRARRAYGHIHLPTGAEAGRRAARLFGPLRTVAASEPRPRIDVGVTGLSAAEEDRLAAEAPPGESVLFRACLEREIPPDPPRPGDLPAGWSRGSAAAVALDELAQLDWNAFQGTADATLVADSVEDDRRVLEEIQANRLGRYLDEASTVLRDPHGAVAAFLLSAEQTPHRAIFLDLVVRADVRRQGVARQLLVWGTRALAALGYESVRLWVSDSNRAARSLYDALGFRPRSRAVIYRFGPSTDPQAHSAR